MNFKTKSHDSLNSSNTELHAYELSQRTPIKGHQKTYGYSNFDYNQGKIPKSSSSIKKYKRTLKMREDRETAELVLSAKIASDKSRDILYTSTMKPLSPRRFSNDEWRSNSYSPSAEVDTSSIKGFEVHQQDLAFQS